MLQILLETMGNKGFYAGINLGNLFEGFENSILVTVTEKRTKEQMDSFVKSLAQILGVQA